MQENKKISYKLPLIVFALCVVAAFSYAIYRSGGDAHEDRKDAVGKIEAGLDSAVSESVSDLELKNSADAPTQGKEASPREESSKSAKVDNKVTTVSHQTDAEDTVVDITFDDVKFEMEKDDDFKESMLNEKIRAMEGKRILIRGYMQPSYKQKGIKSFVFVRDNQECCFGPGAALFDCMIVKLKKGKSTSFQIRPFAVEGDFGIKEYEGPDGKAWAIFRLSNAVVK